MAAHIALARVAASLRRPRGRATAAAGPLRRTRARQQLSSARMRRATARAWACRRRPRPPMVARPAGMPGAAPIVRSAAAEPAARRHVRRRPEAGQLAAAAAVQLPNPRGARPTAPHHAPRPDPISHPLPRCTPVLLLTQAPHAPAGARALVPEQRRRARAEPAAAAAAAAQPQQQHPPARLGRPAQQR
jgi:hypothetical protein